MWVINYIAKLYSRWVYFYYILRFFSRIKNFNQFFNSFKKLFWSEYDFLHVNDVTK